MTGNRSSGAARHLLPQGEKEGTAAPSCLPQGEKGETALPSPLPLRERVAAQRPGEGPPKAFARHLRKAMTEPERKLWAMLKGRRFESFKFRRQVPLGRYVVDFVCFEMRLIVEADGGQHSESAHDETRDAWLVSQGFRVLRFWNSDIHQALDAVMMTILDALREGPSSGASRHLLPQGEKGKDLHDS